MKEQLRRTKKSNSRRPGKRRRLLFLLLACLVVACTTYALMVPAIAQEGEYTCGKEAHSHGVSCYQTDESGNLVKDEGGNLVLICEKEEHQHDERCLVIDQHPERYVCGYAYEHTHEAGCYRDGELICTLVEHTHTEECLAEEYRSAENGSSEQPAETEQTGSGDMTSSEQSAVNQGVSESPTPAGEDVTKAADDSAPSKTKGSLDTQKTANAEPTRDGSLGTSSTTSPDVSDPYCVEMSTLGDLTFDFTVTNKYNTPITDLSLTAGDGYSFSVRVNTPSGLWPEPYFYHYHLDCDGCSLFMDNHTPIEQYTQGWANIGSADLWAVTEAGGYGLFFRCSNPDLSVVECTFSGELGSANAGDETSLNVAKSAAWIIADVTYTNTITAWIPRMYDNYTHYYYLEDHTRVLNPQDETVADAEYDGFLANYYNGSFVVSIDDTPIRSIDQIGENDSDTYAYYLDTDGKLYLLNKTTHSGMHGVSLHSHLKDGWCLCWQDTVRRKLTVTYKDTAGKDYVDGRTYSNTVSLSRPSLADNHTDTLPSTARQKHSSADDFNSSARTFTVTLVKQYTDGNPEYGATFGLYEADTDTLVARSVTEASGDGMVRKVYAVVPAMPNAIYSTSYVPGADEDRVTFINRYLSLNKVYYIKEIETLDGFQLSDQRYYFFVTNPTPAPLPAGYENMSVDILNSWQLTGANVFTMSHQFATPLVNEKIAYRLPETGSNLGLILQVTGILLLLSPTVLFFRNRQKKH